MAGLHLVTGYNGTAHITSADQGGFNAVSVGANDYVFTNGKRFEAQILSSNVVRIFDGSLIMNGRHVNLDSGSHLDVDIASEAEGVNRHDLITVRYEINRTTGVETASLAVIEGTPTPGTPTDPTDYNSGNIINNVDAHDMLLYRVVITGTAITEVEPLFQVLAPMADIQHGFYKQNLLINGDFQINQRGYSLYNAESKVEYTLDMWRAYGIKVYSRNEGVKLIGAAADSVGYFTQFIQLGKLKTTTYTISAMADDKICTFTVTPGETAKKKDFGTFEISALTTSTWDNALNDYNNKLKVNICVIGTNEIFIKYVDVFEGTVAYPHVKEDPATALMRCRRYVQAGTQISPYMWYKTEDSTFIYRCVLSYDPMASKPTLADCNAWYYNTRSEDLGTMIGGISVLTSDSIVNTNAMDIAIDTLGNTLNDRCIAFKLVYLLSCEHLPNGDS